MNTPTITHQIPALAELLEAKRKELGISQNALCRSAHVSKKKYIAFKGRQRCACGAILVSQVTQWT